MINDQQFNRKAIKSRLQDLIVQRWGYEKYEQNAFDPLVDLLISALAKELEKGHLSFEKSFNRIVDFVTERLVPERLNEFEPAFGVLMAHPLTELCAINESNFNASYTSSDDKQIQFVPLGTTNCSPLVITALANFNSLMEYEGLNLKMLSNFEYRTNNIWLGIDFQDFTEAQDVALFFSWMNDPLSDQYISLLKLSKWLINDKVIEADFDRYLKDHLHENYYWKNILAKEKLALVHQKVADQYVTLSLRNEHFENRQTPKFLKALIKEDPSLARMNDLLWVRINVPPHELAKNLSQNLFCQTNCIPVINLNKKSFSKKIRAPFKVVKIDDEDFFLEIVDIENTDGKKYLKAEQEIALEKEKLEGLYQIFSKGIIRIDNKMAYESIVNMIDLIIEEKNAYSSVNPDWIIDELKELDVILNKIKSKTNLDKSNISNNTFLQFENELNEDFIKIQYLTINGVRANGIKIGSSLTINSPYAFQGGDGTVVSETRDGSSFMPSKERKLELVSRIQSRQSIVTRKDIEVHLAKELSPLSFGKITIQDIVLPSFSKSKGYFKVLEVKTAIDNGVIEESELMLLEKRLQAYFDSKAMVGAPIKVSLN